ncbi:outer membrane protein [Sphingomonas mucosissima]|uniref:Outer membrane protein beta-barrel domain-containing protein n=1 Tax=Sphingomonas mucosissima TaxID=370959 RepID=A0A245ZJE4_9SPHN|nr:outer membrane beta-barrel protein [Sphingomonas mucosissima]OWK29846.1 hypothetical protein SPMU_22680 [Sphingomonas mucosissima]
MKYIVASALALAIAAPAVAQTAAPVTSGARVEARVGWDRPVLEQTFGDQDGSLTEKEGKSGVAYGIEAGYDLVTAGPTLIGLYGGIEDSSVKDCQVVTVGDRACIKAGRNITAGARVGFVMTRGMVYLKGGYSNGRMIASYEDPAYPEDNFRLKGDFDGFHLGAGGEVMMSRNVYGKLEYVYTNYADERVGDGEAFGSFDLERHQIVAGVGFRF